MTGAWEVSISMCSVFDMLYWFHLVRYKVFGMVASALCEAAQYCESETQAKELRGFGMVCRVPLFSAIVMRLVFEDATSINAPDTVPDIDTGVDAIVSPPKRIKVGGRRKYKPLQFIPPPPPLPSMIAEQQPPGVCESDH